MAQYLPYYMLFFNLVSHIVRKFGLAVESAGIVLPTAGFNEYKVSRFHFGHAISISLT